MTLKPNQLIRDKDPGILQEQGKRAVLEILDDQQYEKLLGEKFLEEVMRYNEEGTLEAMADVGEVMHAILAFKKIPVEEFQRVRAERMEALGGYGGRLYLTKMLDL